MNPLGSITAPVGAAADAFWDNKSKIGMGAFAMGAVVGLPLAARTGGAAAAAKLLGAGGRQTLKSAGMSGRVAKYGAAGRLANTGSLEARTGWRQLHRPFDTLRGARLRVGVGADGTDRALTRAAGKASLGVMGVGTTAAASNFADTANRYRTGEASAVDLGLAGAFLIPGIAGGVKWASGLGKAKSLKAGTDEAVRGGSEATSKVGTAEQATQKVASSTNAEPARNALRSTEAARERAREVSSMGASSRAQRMDPGTHGVARQKIDEIEHNASRALDDLQATRARVDVPDNDFQTALRELQHARDIAARSRARLDEAARVADRLGKTENVAGKVEKGVGQANPLAIVPYNANNISDKRRLGLDTSTDEAGIGLALSHILLARSAKTV